jgi:hypothetical protein
VAKWEKSIFKPCIKEFVLHLSLNFTTNYWAHTNYIYEVRQMKKLMLVLVLLLGVSTVAVAQNDPVADVFTGYSLNWGEWESVSGDEDIGGKMNGWNAAINFNVNNNWAVTFDVSGHYLWGDMNLKYHTFLVGPKYTFGSSEKVRPYVHALYGVNHVNPEKPFTVENNFVQAYGGGVDVRVTDKVSVRAMQLDYLSIRRYKFEKNLRFSSGFVFRVGQK